MFIMEAEKLTAYLRQENLRLCDYALKQEVEAGTGSWQELREKMAQTLQVMERSVQKARMEPVNSVSGLTGGNAFLYEAYRQEGKSILGETASLAVAMALSCSELNASMECIVACPTAGSCGIVPAVLLACAKTRGLDREQVIDGLFTASAVGIMIGSRATLAGAEGGCQAECGSASAMAAAAAVEMLGGAPEAAFHAGAMALKNVLGLTCDPVAGLVEIPCIKRNASGAVNALLSADLALAGVKSYIPFDEVVDAMYAIGKAMPSEVRETAKGGLAVSPTGQRMRKAAEAVQEDQPEAPDL
ncbi:MAG TPA: L-serine ammonia-lyase, iron-sulfur-dependent, subunit alpha [Candidatus Eisenbergiella merdipullorum]|uniref:L-serine dehydratase n=1 Tax=Candidatus Eisenbergiella merdipullorum TaxID=2838553 RepID=A0A9D2I811_9FIRM|nr:L-serine ammonia-lyase, iron-sulfur-dependent, subunit alpha [Candidatus Eisenbergiella merdipullorum]